MEISTSKSVGVLEQALVITRAFATGSFRSNSRRMRPSSQNRSFLLSSFVGSSPTGVPSHDLVHRPVSAGSDTARLEFAEDELFEIVAGKDGEFQAEGERLSLSTGRLFDFEVDDFEPGTIGIERRSLAESSCSSWVGF